MRLFLFTITARRELVLICTHREYATAINFPYITALDASILVYKFRPERTGFNMYAEYTQLQLNFLALNPCVCMFCKLIYLKYIETKTNQLNTVEQFKYFKMLKLAMNDISP